MDYEMNSFSLKSFRKRSQGFTLIELIVSIGIFVIIALIVTGILASLMKLNRSNQKTRQLLTSMNIAMDSITLPARERKSATRYSCGIALAPCYKYEQCFNTVRKACNTDPCTSSSCAPDDSSNYGENLAFRTYNTVENVLREFYFYRDGNSLMYNRCDIKGADNIADDDCVSGKITPDDIEVTSFIITPVLNDSSTKQLGIIIGLDAKVKGTTRTIHLQTAVQSRNP